MLCECIAVQHLHHVLHVQVLHLLAVERHVGSVVEPLIVLYDVPDEKLCFHLPFVEERGRLGGNRQKGVKYGSKREEKRSNKYTDTKSHLHIFVFH